MWLNAPNRGCRKARKQGQSDLTHNSNMDAGQTVRSWASAASRSTRAALRLKQVDFLNAFRQASLKSKQVRHLPWTACWASLSPLLFASVGSGSWWRGCAIWPLPTERRKQSVGEAPEENEQHKSSTGLTCRSGPLQGGLPLPADLSVTALHVTCPLMQYGGGTPRERRAVNSFFFLLFSVHEVTRRGFNGFTAISSRSYKVNSLELVIVLRRSQTMLTGGLLSFDLSCRALSCPDKREREQHMFQRGS